MIIVGESKMQTLSMQDQSFQFVYSKMSKYIFFKWKKRRSCVLRVTRL